MLNYFKKFSCQNEYLPVSEQIRGVTALLPEMNYSPAHRILSWLPTLKF